MTEQKKISGTFFPGNSLVGLTAGTPREKNEADLPGQHTSYSVAVAAL
jgi:hypothetical protein